jgi:uncharacterized protein (TIGR03437 family)
LDRSRFDRSRFDRPTLDRPRLIVAATLLAAIFIAPAALAQTPVNISIISGNGQIICPECTLAGQGLVSFQPLMVRVTDANGNAVPNATVNWTVAAGQAVVTQVGGSLVSATQTVQTFTDVNGNTGAQAAPDVLGSPPYLASTVSAAINSSSAVSATVNFYLTEVVPNTGIFGNPTTVLVLNETPSSSPACATCINPGDTLTGTAGSTSSTQFEINVAAPGYPVSVVPNVSLRLVSNQGSPTISCATGAGADPGSVLTDQNGNAICNAILGSTPGVGSFYALVGGVNPNISGAEPAFFSTGNYNLNVTPGVPAMLSVVSGNGQSGNPGQALSGALVAAVGDSSGNPLASQPVTWTVSPAAAATLSNTSTTSSASGQVSTDVALTSLASGTIQIKVALVSNPSISFTFTLTANIQVSGLQIVSGNSQSAVVNTNFASPLVVQLSTSNGSSDANIGVSFSISGPATLSASSATTNSLGQAQVNVTASSTTGAVTVTAKAGSFSQTFSLTVIPQGPTLTSSSFYNGADFQQGSISPCSIATIKATGLAPAIQGAVAYDGIGGLPYQLAGDTVTVGGARAPIYNVANVGGQQQVTFQVPCSVLPGSNAVAVSVSGSSGTVNVTVLPASPGLFLTEVSSTVTVPVLERPDGSFVSPTNPGRLGETLIAYVTGLGPTTPAVATNSLPIPGSTASVQGTVTVGIAFNGSASGESAISASLTQDIVGVYLVAFQVPSSVPSGTNVGFDISVVPQGSSTPYYSMLGSFPVQ